MQVKWGIIIVVVFLGTTTMTTGAQRPSPTDPWELVWHIGPWVPAWSIETFHSQTVDQEVGYLIYLPPDYKTNPTRRYPVVYWLHGATGSLAGALPVIERLDTSIRANKAPAMILVSCLDPTKISMWTDSKDGRVPVETVIIRDLISHVDTNYRTLARREARGIEGFSMGGYGAAYLGFKYPELFGLVSILSAALHTPDTFKTARPAIFDNVFGGDISYADARSPWMLVRNSSGRIRDYTKVRIHVGGQDLLKEWNTDYHRLLDSLNIPHAWSIIPDSPHNLENLLQNWSGDFFAFYQEAFEKLE